jgi:hypothetical protein
LCSIERDKGAFDFASGTTGAILQLQNPFDLIACHLESLLRETVYKSDDAEHEARFEHRSRVALL